MNEEEWREFIRKEDAATLGAFFLIIGIGVVGFVAGFLVGRFL